MEHVSLAVVMRKSSRKCQTSETTNNFQLEAKVSHRYKVNSTAKVCIKMWPGLLKLTADCQDYVTVSQKGVLKPEEIPSVPTIKPLDVVHINQNREHSNSSWDSWLR